MTRPEAVFTHRHLGPNPDMECTMTKDVDILGLLPEV